MRRRAMHSSPPWVAAAAALHGLRPFHRTGASACLPRQRMQRRAMLCAQLCRPAPGLTQRPVPVPWKGAFFFLPARCLCGHLPGCLYTVHIGYCRAMLRPACRPGLWCLVAHSPSCQQPSRETSPFASHECRRYGCRPTLRAGSRATGRMRSFSCLRGALSRVRAPCGPGPTLRSRYGVSLRVRVARSCVAQAAAEGSGKAADGPGLATATQPKCDGPLQCLLRLGPGELGMLNFPCPLPCALFCTLNHETLQLVVSLMLAGWQGDPVQPEEAAATAPPTSDPLPLPGPLPLPVPGLGDPLPQAPSSDPLPQAPSTRWQRAAPHGQAQATGGPGAAAMPLAHGEAKAKVMMT